MWTEQDVAPDHGAAGGLTGPKGSGGGGWGNTVRAGVSPALLFHRRDAGATVNLPHRRARNTARMNAPSARRYQKKTSMLCLRT